MNEVTIASPNLFYESLSFLERAYHKEIEYDGNDYEQLYKSLSAKQLFDERKLHRKIKAAKALQKKVCKSVNLTQEEIQLYFSSEGGGTRSIAKALAAAYIDYQCTDLEYMKKQAYALCDTYGYSLFLFAFCKEDMLEQEEIENKDVNFMTFLKQKKDISDSDKWKLAMICQDIKGYLRTLFDLLEPAVHMMEKEIQLYTSLIIDFQAYLQTLVDKEMEAGKEISIQSFCDDAFMDKESIDKKIIISPSIAELNAITWVKNNKIDQDSCIYFIGILMDDSYHRENHVLSREALLQNLKLLSDHSKFEILKLLRHKSMYGQEICEQLNLSKATISHHMAALSSANFITIREEKNRLYYDINETLINDLLQHLSKELL